MIAGLRTDTCAQTCVTSKLCRLMLFRPGTGNRLLLIRCSARAAKGHEGGNDSSVLTFPGAWHQGEFTHMVTSIARNAPRGLSTGSPRLDVLYALSNAPQEEQWPAPASASVAEVCGSFCEHAAKRGVSPGSTGATGSVTRSWSFRGSSLMKARHHDVE